MLVYFKPDPGMPPVVLEALGGCRIFHPRDQVWKKVQKQLNNFPLKDPYDKTKTWMKDGEVVYRKNVVTQWEVDKEATEKLKKGELPLPPDFFEMSNDEWQILGTGRNSHLRKFFVKAEKVDAEHKAAYATVKQEHEKKLAEMKKLIEAKERELAEQVAEMDRKIREANKKLEQNSLSESKLPPPRK